MATRNHSRIKIGDHVQFTLGTSLVQGVVVDDRGPIGAGNVHIFQVSVSNDPYDDEVFEMPEDEINVVQRDTSRTDGIRAEEAIEYFEHGGLVRILRAGMSGGKAQPRVWLCRDSLGNITHTFSSERGTLGGAIIPFFALHDNRVFTAKRNDVLDFLTAFGLTAEAAEHILRSLGTAP